MLKKSRKYNYTIHTVLMLVTISSDSFTGEAKADKVVTFYGATSYVPVKTRSKEYTEEMVNLTIRFSSWMLRICHESALPKKN